MCHSRLFRKKCRRWLINRLTSVLLRFLSTLELILRILGAFLIFLALSLIGIVTLSYFLYVVPNSSFSKPFVFVQTCIGLSILFHVLYCHMKACCTDPGYPPPVEDPTELGLEVEIEEGTQAELPYCRKCQRYKPPRCHHCSMCNRCVLKMDHHCPWINQCVGFHNYRYFLLFLLWLFLGSVFIAVVSFPVFRLAAFTPSMFPSGPTSRQIALFSWAISFAIGIAIAILGGFHVFLLYTNQTTIEFQKGAFPDTHLGTGKVWRNIFDIGRKENFRQVFGPSRYFLWTIPWISAGTTGDGMCFPSIKRHW